MFDTIKNIAGDLAWFLKRGSRRLPKHLRKLSDEEWLDLLIRSITAPDISGVKFPGFPPAELQVRFVGSEYESALREAFQFYIFYKKQAALCNKPIQRKNRFLDFGCGWGRFLRFLWKDIDVRYLYGCDVNEEILKVCRSTGVPGNLALISPEGHLPYSDNFFDGIVAYSVFTHLPENLHLHWMQELARVSKQGCIVGLTLEPRRFIDFMKGIPEDTGSEWYRMLSKFAGNADSLYQQYDAGDISYLPTYGEHIGRTFGDAIVPLSFIEHNWADHFEIKTYIDDPSQFWQAALVLQRK